MFFFFFLRLIRKLTFAAHCNQFTFLKNPPEYKHVGPIGTALLTIIMTDFYLLL